MTIFLPKANGNEVLFSNPFEKNDTAKEDIFKKYFPIFFNVDSKGEDFGIAIFLNSKYNRYFLINLKSIFNGRTYYLFEIN